MRNALPIARGGRRPLTRVCVALLCLTIWTVAACEPRLPLRPPNDPLLIPTESECPPDSALTYENFGREFFDAYCQSCHASSVQGADRNGAPSSHTYDVVESIREEADEIDARAAAGPAGVNTTMPNEEPRPTELERLDLGEWLACGAP